MREAIERYVEKGQAPPGPVVVMLKENGPYGSLHMAGDVVDSTGQCLVMGAPQHLGIAACGNVEVETLERMVRRMTEARYTLELPWSNIAAVWLLPLDAGDKAACPLCLKDVSLTKETVE